MIDVRPQETWVRVPLHEVVDDPLGIVKAHCGGRLNVPSDQVSGLVINVDLEAEENYSEIRQKWVIFVERISLHPCAYLSHGLSLNVPFEDLFGPGGHSEG